MRLIGSYWSVGNNAEIRSNILAKPDLLFRIGVGLREAYGDPAIDTIPKHLVDCIEQIVFDHGDATRTLSQEGRAPAGEVASSETQKRST